MVAGVEGGAGPCVALYRGEAEVGGGAGLASSPQALFLFVF